MDEKTMVNDVLSSVKAGLTKYQGVISETENMQLRQTIQQIRNSDEAFQYELFKLLKQKDIISLLNQLLLQKFKL